MKNGRGERRHEERGAQGGETQEGEHTQRKPRERAYKGREIKNRFHTGGEEAQLEREDPRNQGPHKRTYQKKENTRGSLFMAQKLYCK